VTVGTNLSDVSTVCTVSQILLRCNKCWTFPINTDQFPCKWKDVSISRDKD